MRRMRLAHWEIVGLAQVGLLGLWLARPGPVPAATILIFASLAVLVTARDAGRRVGPILLAVLALLGAWVTTASTRRRAAAETNWAADSTGVRWGLVQQAGERLATTLEEAVQQVEALAQYGAAQSGASRDVAAERLASAVGGQSPERGVVVFDSTGRPWVWAGRHRLPPVTAADSGLGARITPFYAKLEAWRQGMGGAVAVAHVLLYADEAVPNRDRTVAAAFSRETGVELEFFGAGRGPYWADVFDYCLPSCAGTETRPDTLFSVRLVPPTQGSYKLRLLAEGSDRAAMVALATLVPLIVFGGLAARVGATAVLGGLLLFTPAGSGLPLGMSFSSATYFSELLGPLSSSAGHLIITATLVLLAAAGLWRRGIRLRWWSYVAAASMIVVTPSVLQVLAAGITPPDAGPDLGLWLQWEVLVTLATGALVMLAAAFVRGTGETIAQPWMAWVAGVWAALAALIGLVTWQPVTGWAPWYFYVWLPAIALAIQPAPRLRLVVTVAIVAGTAAALLTWRAATEGRLLLAERDASGLRQGGDPVAVGLLERFGSRLQEDELPRTAGELYGRWSRSVLYNDGYPSSLVSWSPAGAVVARLELASLDIDEALLRQLAETSSARFAPRVDELLLAAGAHYVLTVPFPDGSAVTVSLGPRSRVIEPVRIASFLRGERVVPRPYEMAITEPIIGAVTPSGRLNWRREGWTVRGDERLGFGVGERHLHATIALGGFSGLFVRGVLVATLNVVLIGLLWLASEGIAGMLEGWLAVRKLLAPRSYRARLGLAFAVFIVVPTVGFALWTARGLKNEARRSRDLIIGQTLEDAAIRARDFVNQPDALVMRELDDLADRLSAELVLYEEGALRQASAPVLVELGVLDHYLPRHVHQALGDADLPEITTDERVATHETRIGYRNLGGRQDRTAVLAVPRLVEDAVLVRSERDLAFGLAFVTLLGLGIAAGLATLAARALGEPVQLLRQAADQVGRGEVPSPFGRDAPDEFVPVMNAFTRMASDVHATRAALEAQRQRTVAVLRNVATGVIAMDDRLAVTMANPTAERLLGRRLAVGRPVSQQSPAEWIPVWRWVRAVSQAREEVAPCEFTIEERQIRAQVTPLTGDATGWVVTLDDISELARAVRVLAWGELARQVAHEIKNPLTPIRLGIQHLQRSFDAPRGDYAATLDRTSRQMLDEIERLDAIARAFSRFGAPPAEKEPLVPIDVADACRDTAALYNLGEQDLVHVQADAVLHAIARRDELKEVLINLIENAKGAGARSIVLSVERSDGRVAVAVRDDGRGIAAEDLPRVFEPQFSTTTSGTGLGLAICKRLVESWGGLIAATSEPGVGTAITLTLPT